MKFIPLKIKGLVVIEPQTFGDERGFFMETYSKKLFAENGISIEFVQDNHSRSSKGVLRGLHFQRPPFAQDKLIRVSRGEVFDVAVDVRHDSPTFGQWEGVTLSEENKKMFFIPKGFAHGFLVLSDIADFQYKCSSFYSVESEGGVAWDDEDLKITWPMKDGIVLSKRDKTWPKLKDMGQLDFFAHEA